MSTKLEELLGQIGHFAPPPVEGEHVAYNTNVTVLSVPAGPIEVAQLNTRRVYLAIINVSNRPMYILPNASVSAGTGIPIGGIGGGIAIGKMGPVNPSLGSWWATSAFTGNVVVIEAVRVG